MPVVNCILKNALYDCPIEDFVCIDRGICTEECSKACPKYQQCEYCNFNEADNNGL